MAKKKQKIKRTKEKLKKCKMSKEDKKVKDTLEISQTVTDVKSFIEKFKTDVKKKRKDYQLFAQRFQRKK